MAHAAAIHVWAVTLSHPVVGRPRISLRSWGLPML
jgi:hypothetical protein